jgi:GNAT superfamily N-acetyltransferase
MRGPDQRSPASEPLKVVPANAADVDALSQLIAAAFHDLAPSRWLISDPGVRREIFPGYFRIYVEHALTEGVVNTTPDRAAVALWLPVGTSQPVPGPGYNARLRAATDPCTGRFRIFDRELDRHHPVGTPHHHLAILAVQPNRQQQGIGTALLRAHHATLDEAGMPAYLEAADLNSRRLYQAHGYVLQPNTPIRLPDGPEMWPMWRKPSTGAHLMSHPAQVASLGTGR